ncbi:MAG: O-antigen ligase family protein, partial [Anaerolineae bacterium]
TVHPNVMAGALLCAAFVAMAWALWPPRASAGARWPERLLAARVLWVLAGLLMLLVLFLTKSRGAYGASLVGIAVLAALAARRRMALAGIVLVALALAVGGGLWVLQQTATGSADELEILDTSSFAFRQRVWHYALLLVGDFPLTGVGMGGFNEALYDLYGYSAFAQPSAHSLYLQAALDLGLPGLAALLALIGAAAWRAVAGLRRMRAVGDGLWPLAAGAIACLAAVLAQGLIDITVWSTRGGFMLWWLLALLYALGSAEQWADTAERHSTRAC